jgi:hypothetical protein
VKALVLTGEKFIPDRIVAPLIGKLTAAGDTAAAAHSLNEVTGMISGSTASQARADATW